VNAVDAQEQSVIVDIIAAVFDGGAYLHAFLASLAGQTYREWRLWVRDDGSRDATIEIIRAAAAGDSRIRLLPPDGMRRGAAHSFSRLLEALPIEAAYIMCADQDDVWLPVKIEHTLAAMRAAESETPGPLLVHTDLVVVDADLAILHPSLWEYSHVRPEPATLRRLVVQNVATGSTVMLNRALRLRIGVMPADAYYHDWWYSCVAAAFGRVVVLREATILYRQHASNVVGAKRSLANPWHEIPVLVRNALRQRATFRAQFRRGAEQAGAFLARYGHELQEPDRAYLEAYARLPDLPFARRKLDIIRLRLRREFGWWRNLGVLLRA
jgi:glycosyltransferase involved in cell wall biosynthesis